MANQWFRTVIRHPQTALTVPGLGGGTLIDAAPWGYRDRLHEAIPLVGGGWLDVEEFEAGEDRIRVAGWVAPLPDRPASAQGSWAEVTWVIDPDLPWLRLEGADGLYLHPALDFDLLDGQLWEAVVYGQDGEMDADLGGAVRFSGSTGLLIERSGAALSYLASDLQVLSGTATGADTLALFREGEVIGRLHLTDDTFDLLVPADADGVRAEAPGRAPSATVPPGAGLDLSPGPPGGFVIDVAWDGHRPRPVQVAWSDREGRAGVVVLPPMGGALRLGAGKFDVTLSAGPSVAPRALVVEVGPEEAIRLGASMSARFDPGSRVLADLAWPGTRSRSWRGTDAQALRRAVGEGLGFVVVAPEDDAADATADPTDLARIRWRNGALLTSTRGWAIASWPWAATPRRGGHGVAPVRDMSAADALAAAWGGAATSRFTVVDLAWLEEVGPPWTVAPHPDFVRLDHPGVAGPISGSWDAWFDWLDAGAALVPVGPRAWVEVDDLDVMGAEDVEFGLVRGHVTATSGPLVTLTVDDVGPGEVVFTPGVGRPVPNTELRAHLTVASAATLVDRVALVSDGGEILGQWTPDNGQMDTDLRLRGTHRWMIAVAWSTNGAAWATTNPVWIQPPGSRTGAR
jgi:hypothetical protein